MLFLYLRFGSCDGGPIFWAGRSFKVVTAAIFAVVLFVETQKSNFGLNVFLNMETGSVSSIQFLLISQVFDCPRKSVTNIQKYNDAMHTNTRTNV